MQRLLEKRGIPYTGEGVAGQRTGHRQDRQQSALRANAACRRRLRKFCATAADPTLALPFVIKAPREGSSVGVYIVRELRNCPPPWRRHAACRSELLVEQYIAGRELTVGVVGGEALPVIEIRAKTDFYNFENKYPFLNPQAAGADHFCPAPLSPKRRASSRRPLVRAHGALDLQVYSRVDLLFSETGEPFVIEVNTIPGMTPSSLLPEAAAAAGLSYPELCARIIALSLAARRA